MKVNYSNCKIYKLINRVNNYFYIGSTCDNLSKRLSHHKYNAKKLDNIKLYKYFNEIGWENVKIILIIELNDCKNREQQIREEQKYIEENKNNMFCLNSINALGRSKESIEKRKKQTKEWLYNNYDYIKEYRKIKIYCECGSVVTILHKTRHEKTKKHINYFL